MDWEALILARQEADGCTHAEDTDGCCRYCGEPLTERAMQEDRELRARARQLGND